MIKANCELPFIALKGNKYAISLTADKPFDVYNVPYPVR